MSQTFQKNVEDFICINCSAQVSGNGFTDHCPRCLYSLHVDVNPGDRSNQCRGIFKPVNVAPYKSGYKIFYQCETCGTLHSNKSAPDDNITSFVESLNIKDF